MKNITFKAGAILFSVFLHSLLFASFDETSFSKKESKNRPSKPMKVSLAKPKVEKKVEKKEPIVKKKKIKKPKKIVKKIPKKVIKKPVERVVLKKEPVKPVIVQEPVKREEVVDYAQEKNIFLVELKEKIEENKIYPKAARRRGVEGVVELSFSINNSGNIENLALTGAKVLRKAAKKAIEDSFPVKKEKFFPMNITLKLNYTLS